MSNQDEVAKLREQLLVQSSAAADNEKIFLRLLEREIDLLKARSLRELLEKMTVGLANSYGLNEVSLVLWDPEHELRHLLVSEAGAEIEVPGVRLVDSMTAVTPQLQRLRSVWLGPYLGGDHKMLFGQVAQLASVAMIPLMREENLIGCLCFASVDDRRFTRHHATSFLAHLGTVASFVIENAVNRARILRSGFTDVLTGMYNRRYLETRLVEEIARAQRDQRMLTCLMLDVDHFKQVNDTYGHQAGDRVLREIGRRVQAQIRTSDVAARYGGEEFAVLMPATRAREALRLAERIRKAVSAAPMQATEEQALTVTVSMGIAETMPVVAALDLATLGQGLVSAADVALYRAKADGRDCVRMAD
ncbi:MAG: sensor domain-containing diguanylate cyclase [Gammaproteobacteria bacterium]|jgi:diguanylate cyclase (GGDEF)-like protein|nr:sensor domain-containing diguanylate cyclase [Gammaproteobacteria bacterium]